MTQPPPPTASARTGRTRSRRGRGVRGPLTLPGPLTPGNVPVVRSPRSEFDALVVAVVERLRRRRGAQLDAVEFAVEDAPLLPPAWSADEVPLGSLVREPQVRVVVFRLPLAARADGRDATMRAIGAVLAEQLGALWQIDPADVDPFG